ncbi:MAG TPA: ZIP family metal transporter [Thermoanaerobaculia bacterium]|nr:ZIP family metal transporter [Thermoanaerobaculia bacterium]
MKVLSDQLSGFPVFFLGLLASVAASLGTGAGALPVLAIRSVSPKAQDVLQSAAAGIMLAATAFSLVAPGVQAGARLLGHPVSGALAVAASAFLGATAVLVLHRRAPHEHFVSGLDGPASNRLRRTWLFVIAITLHNFPEGLSVGVGFGGGDVANGLELTLAILLQNIPEGFVVALGLLAAGFSPGFSVLVSCATGFVETLGGLVGATAVSLSSSALPWALGVSAGAMLFVISHEIVPETHRNGFEVEATFGLLGGFFLMVALGAALRA